MPRTILVPRGLRPGSREAANRGAATGLSQAHEGARLRTVGIGLERVIPIAIWNLHCGDIDLALHVRRRSGVLVLGMPLDNSGEHR